VEKRDVWQKHTQSGAYQLQSYAATTMNECNFQT